MKFARESCYYLSKKTRDKICTIRNITKITILGKIIINWQIKVS